MIIGRKTEQKILNKLYTSTEAEFLVIYGRRRVGKTTLIRDFFENKKCVLFHATGLQKGNLKAQLTKFSEAISDQFFDGTAIEVPTSWSRAFRILHKQISKATEKVVIFLDELPWMATKKSGLLQEIDYYWNHYWSKSSNIILIVCGSSASWLIKKIIYNKGGLHNRITSQIKLAPFDLSETRAYLQSRKVKLNNRHIVSVYMALGGIPYYLRYVEPGLSAEQNIQKIFFDREAPLKEEFSKLFDSLFENANAYIEIVSLIAKKTQGMSRSEIKSNTLLSSGGGRLSKRLGELCETGFIEEYIPWGKDRGEYYKLIDEFCLFYFHWLHSKQKRFTQEHWLTQSQRPAYYAWSGYAYEAICMKHSKQIINALNIKTSSAIGSWIFKPRKELESGAQIDLIIDRNDSAITLCEIKYTEKMFVIDKSYAKTLQHKVEVFREKTKTSKQLFMAMITANGLKSNAYSNRLIDAVVTLDDLFK
ncbi:MAG: AAA family ATPase [Legionellales bacterium]|nr:AAA family ATPase [Legionellales bacterium]